MSSVGEYLKRLRLSKGMTQEELGNIIGVKKAAVQKWESGMVQNLKRNTIKQLADFFNVPPSSFIDGSEQPEPTKSPATKEDLKFALFNGSEGITDEMYEEVKKFAELVKLREEQKKGKK